MFNVSFCGPKVPYNPTKPIDKLTAAQIAEAINIGVGQAGNDLGQTLIHPYGTKKLTGKLLTEHNPDSFDKTTGTLTEAGKKGFNNVYGRQFGVNASSPSKDLVNCAKEVAKNRSDEDGVICYCFDVMA